MVCAACGSRNVDDASRCVSCGHSFGPAPTLGPADLPPGLSSGLATDSLAGRVIADRYVIGGLLGKGGVGAVYRARDKVVNEDIAIKVLQESPSRDPADLDRFRRELVTSRKVSHPNVIRIHDMGVLGTEFFISMELLEGGSLASLLRKGAPAISRAVEIAIGICEGLHAAHLQGVVHRDIKPDNVIFDVKGVPKLMDFGLARLTTSGTRTQGFSGTPFYMSPEQADGADPTAKSDIYSLGVLIFELFTGRLPFVSESLVRLIVLHTQERPPAPRSFRPEIPPEIEALILRCLEKKAAQRPESAADIANTLRRFALRQTLGTFDPGPTPALPSTGVARWVLAAAGLSGVVALGLAFGLGGKPDASATSTPDATGTVAIAIASATPSGTATPTPTPPTPTPSATRTAIAVVATPIPTAPILSTPAASPAPGLEPGRLSFTRSTLSIGSVGRLEVFVDGVYRSSLPDPNITLAPGTRVIQFRRGTEILLERNLEVLPGDVHRFSAARDTADVVTILELQ